MHCMSYNCVSKRPYYSICSHIGNSSTFTLACIQAYLLHVCKSACSHDGMYSSMYVLIFGHDTDNVFVCSRFM